MEHEPDPPPADQEGEVSRRGSRRLSDLIGVALTTIDGTKLGVVVDLEVGYDATAPVLRRWMLRDGRRTIMVTAAVRSTSPRSIVVEPVAVASEADADADADGDVATLLLVRDVLDCQVFDLTGRRLARVGDVFLRFAPGGSITVESVDLGAGSIVRRFGLRRIGRRLGDEIVGWSDLHLVSERGHAAQLATGAAAVHHLGADELVDLVEPLPAKRGADILAAVPHHRAAHVLRRVHRHDAERIIDSMPRETADLVVDELPPEHAEALRPATRTGIRSRRRFLRHRPHLRGTKR